MHVYVFIYVYVSKYVCMYVCTSANVAAVNGELRREHLPGVGGSVHGIHVCWQQCSGQFFKKTNCKEWELYVDVCIYVFLYIISSLFFITSPIICVYMGCVIIYRGLGLFSPYNTS